MSITPQTISAGAGARTGKKRLGRGNSSQKGTSSGRGGKGQTARSGGKSGNKLMSMKRIAQKVPKLRGFTSQYPKKESVQLSSIERITKAGDIVTPALLKKKGVIGTPEYGVKIVGNTTLTHAVTIKGCFASKQATAAIEKAGGKLVF